MKKTIRVVKTFKIVKGSCSLNRYYRVRETPNSCNYCDKSSTMYLCKSQNIIKRSTLDLKGTR